jgi:CBS domain-containing protein
MSPTSISHPAYFGPSFSAAKVRDAMRVGVVTCRPDAPPAQAARVMSGYGIHCLVLSDPVAAAAHRSNGIVDALDVARAEAEGCRRVDEVARPAVTIDSDAPLADAARLMAERTTSHLVVVQPGTDRYVGVVSTSALAAVLAWGQD